jgi:ADP-ribose pyrophosphatase
VSDENAAAEVMWEGKYVCALKRGRWEYVSRVGDVRAVVIMAEFEGKTILIEQQRIAVGGRCLELPAGRVERLGDFHASPGMVSESFTLVRAHGVTRSGEGGGTEHEDIKVHLVARADIPNFVEQKRAEGFAIDVKLLLFLNY